MGETDKLEKQQEDEVKVPKTIESLTFPGTTGTVAEFKKAFQKKQLEEKQKRVVQLSFHKVLLNLYRQAGCLRILVCWCPGTLCVRSRFRILLAV